MTVKEPTGILGQIYDAAGGNCRWSDTLRAIADFSGMENAALVIVDPRLNYSSVVTPRADPAIVEAYAQYWWQEDPTAIATARMPPGRLTTLADTGREAFFSSTFYNDFWRHAGLGAERVATNLVIGDGAFSSIVLQPSVHRDEVDERALRALSLLSPHLARAVAISRKLHRLELANALLTSGVPSDHAGTFLVDATMRPVFMDDGAESLCLTGQHIAVSSGIIRLSEPALDGALQMAVAACARCTPATPCGTTLQFSETGDFPALLIDVIPFTTNIASPWGTPPVAALIVRDPQRLRAARIEGFKRRFGLTQAEAVLAFEMLKGDGRAAAAKRCGISVNTVRTHLTRIFEKTGVSRQAELITVLNAIGDEKPAGF